MQSALQPGGACGDNTFQTVAAAPSRASPTRKAARSHAIEVSMKRLLLAAALAVSFSAQAATIVGFTGAYAPGNWTQSPGTGTVNVFNANDLSLTSGDDQSFNSSATDVGIVVAQPKVTISFDWAFVTQDPEGPFYDPFGVNTLLSGVLPPPLFTVLSDSSGVASQSGTFSVMLEAGDLFAFSQQTLDNFGGSATTRISNFRVDVTEVPEPSTIALLAITLAGGLTVRRRASA
jgi:hypothetical protein